MKIIFLDLDGVLNVYCESRDKFGCCFHKHFEDNLRYIIDNTNAKIVISSTWRHDGLDVMQKMWKFRNLPGEVIDITPNEILIVQKGICEFYDLVDRGHEIQYWLDITTFVIDSYVILDDDNDMLDSQRKNFVRCSNNQNHPDHIDRMGYGLTRICAEKSIEILNGI